MKKVISVLAFILWVYNTTYGQSPTCDCKKELDFVIEQLKKTPSFKKQIKGDRLMEFENVYKASVTQFKNPIDIKKCFKLIVKQMKLINDFHLQLYFNHEYIAKNDIKSKEKISAFLNSESFKDHPKISKNIDSLKIRLNSANEDAIDGIYKLGTSKIHIGMVKTSPKIFKGVVLSSENELWTKGQIYMTATQNEFGKYDLIYHDLTTRKLQMINSILFENGRLLSLKKIDNSLNNEFKNDKVSNWEFKQLNDKVQYVYFGSFSNSESNVKAFKKFYKKHKKSFNAPYIIVDVRSNGGGNDKWSNPFYKLLKKSKAKLFILTNAFTISNGEQFTLKLKSIKNSIHLGQTTYGAIAYGNNYGKNYNSPSGYFSMYLTDMNYHQYIKYEGFGIVPDRKLKHNTDWISQVLEIIKTEKTSND